MYLPWIASPLEKADRPGGSDPGTPDHAKSPVVHTGARQVDAGHVNRRDGELPSFKHHHESSTVELFYDLFFVANLATFTSNHEIVDAKC